MWYIISSIGSGTTFSTTFSLVLGVPHLFQGPSISWCLICCSLSPLLQLISPATGFCALYWFLSLLILPLALYPPLSQDVISLVPDLAKAGTILTPFSPQPLLPVIYRLVCSYHFNTLFCDLSQLGGFGQSCDCPRALPVFLCPILGTKPGILLRWWWWVLQICAQ